MLIHQFIHANLEITNEINALTIININCALDILFFQGYIFGLLESKVEL
jgi:hypothetical protein